MIMPMAVRILPLNGIFRLCRKLPSTISEAAHVVPAMEALIHLSVITVSGGIENADFFSTIPKKMVGSATLIHDIEEHFGPGDDGSSHDINVMPEQYIGEQAARRTGHNQFGSRGANLQQTVDGIVDQCQACHDHDIR